MSTLMGSKITKDLSLEVATYWLLLRTKDQHQVSKIAEVAYSYLVVPMLRFHGHIPVF